MSSFGTAVANKLGSKLQVASGGSKVTVVRSGGRWGRWRVGGDYTVVYVWPTYVYSAEPPVPHLIYIVDRHLEELVFLSIRRKQNVSRSDLWESQ